LAGGLQFPQLAISLESGATTIKIAGTDELLATLNGVPLNQIGSDNFMNY